MKVVDNLAEAEADNVAKTLLVVENIGDIFDAPDHAVIIHACNCYGHWGAGIALAFKKLYPTAYDSHSRLCRSRKPDQLIGTSQLIPPSKGNKRYHYVGCLFTSRRMGKQKDSPAKILDATGTAMRDLLGQIAQAQEDGAMVSEVRICQINSGLFNVPWSRTRSVLEGIKVLPHMPEVVEVYTKA